MSTTSFGSQVSACSTNLFASAAFTPKGGFRPMMRRRPSKGRSSRVTWNQSFFVKLKSFCTVEDSFEDQALPTCKASSIEYETYSSNI
jgi:hypothetical protein